ncbi:exodeoxyribonuclease VII large subunit [Mariprofundus micogutta]|uniref:Exodeoxyribonuclease 7 large subunit n=1 Tax=Mariprofundus micogutta TaxID=1921010 RepID=A0A1L8CKT7_9PROT|nr:exodeoxyribonuclease VII large subunit [Mariprofundus micogutta]GAV19505.1 exodeoxyribonuclease VII large subunit [Mariprofundus micogutta]
MSSDPKVLSVTELTAHIKQVLEQGFSQVRLIGEVSRLTSPASGHLYFTIKDAHAAISAVVWRSTAMRLKNRPEEGGEFIFSGHLSLYEPRGSYQLIVTRIEVAGAGQLADEYERRKQLFAERGWFDSNAKLAIPTLPRHIGIITSATAAAFGDVKKVLATRPAWLELTLSPAVVQGSTAPRSIATAMSKISAMSHPPDVLLIIRGGGSMEDLWCFNDETVVKAIVDCPIPVISGIGHEIDITLADLAADVRAATPSNAAEICCPAKDELREQLPRLSSLSRLIRQHAGQLSRTHDNLQQRQTSSWQRQMDARHHQSEQSLRRLSHAAQINIQQMRQPLRQIEKRLFPLQPGQRLQQQRALWNDRRHELAQGLKFALQHRRRHLDFSRQQLHDQTRQLQRIQQRFAVLSGKLSELSPEKVLDRGYSLNYAADGSLITRAMQLKTGDAMQIRFRDGAANTRIESITKEKNS